MQPGEGAGSGASRCGLSSFLALWPWSCPLKLLSVKFSEWALGSERCYTWQNSGLPYVLWCVSIQQTILNLKGNRIIINWKRSPWGICSLHLRHGGLIILSCYAGVMGKTDIDHHLFLSISGPVTWFQLVTSHILSHPMSLCNLRDNLSPSYRWGSCRSKRLSDASRDL